MPHHAPAQASALGPDFEFDQVLAQLVERADHMQRSHHRLRDLIRVNNDLTSNLDLETVLRKIVEIGVELVHAEYGAMGVIADDNTLEQLITVGMDDATIALVGEMPQGKGLLGALIDDPSPVRLAEISDDARSSGFPADHPPMRSFLGVPIRVREQVYGNLYLTDSRNGEFTADDEELAQSLAATAGIAIANARLFEDSLYRENWASALAETARLLIQDDDEEHLGFLMGRVKDLADAALVAIARVSSSGEDLIIDRAVGAGAEEMGAMSFPVDGSASGEAVRTRQPVLIPDTCAQDFGFAQRSELGPAMTIPVAMGSGVGGVLIVARLHGSPVFGVRDLDMGTSFASHVSVSIERAESRMVRQRVALLEERSRIARDLHDHVIQRLYATGLSLQAVAMKLPAEAAEDVTGQIREIDASIAQIRQSIFALNRDSQVTTVNLRARVLEIVDRVETQEATGLRPRVTFLGPVDLMADATLTDDVAAVVTEALANVQRHADAQKVDLVISAAAGQVTVEVTDDGTGPGASPRLSGLANLRARAEGHGGSFELLPASGGGTQMIWSVPA
ncbi:sensor histidine kinase [Aeromicrobium sp. CF3.5]|uniref:sensor histidine kinase n=1 Tax=Aeromicrobium sp. CF3.5 TaxID=3373078 RepID=UPI003EE5B744